MTEQKTLAVNILDREYLVACPSGQEKKLTEAAETLNNKMREIRETGKVFGIERIAVMAALNLTHELLQTRPENATDRTALERLHDKLDGTLPVNNSQESLGFDLGD